jgi:hypothetical protein
MLAKRSEPVMSILKQIFDPPKAARVTAILFDHRYAAGGSERGSPCLVSPHSRGLVPLGLLLDIERKFRFEIAV